MSTSKFLDKVFFHSSVTIEYTRHFIRGKISAEEWVKNLHPEMTSFAAKVLLECFNEDTVRLRLKKEFNDDEI